MKRPFHVKVLLREIDKRKQKNSRYSLRAFASFLGLAPSTLSRIINCTQEPSVSAIKKIMKKLQLSEDEKIFFIASVAEEKKVRTLQTLGKIPGAPYQDFRFSLESLAELAMKSLSDGCIIFLKNKNNETIVHAKHKFGQNQLLRTFKSLPMPLTSHPIFLTDKPVIIDRQDQYEEMLSYLNAHSLLCVPVLKGEKRLGFITFLRTEEREGFCDEDVLWAQELSSKATFVFHLLTEA